ncbi:MAG: IS630 family transposase [Planctomycetes bacterium]|nr:IS630 family transposase [Planctomycetota bacterium]
MNETIIPRPPRWLKRRLRRDAAKTREADHRTRLQIVLLYDEGLGTARIADLLGTVPSRAINVLHRFRDLGEEGLLDRRRENGSPKVDDDLLQALAELLAGSPEDCGWERPTWTREILGAELAIRTGVVLSERTIGRMLEALGARWGAARPVVFCPWSSTKKNRRLREIRDLLENLPRGHVAYFVDEVDIHLNPRIGRDWMLRGQQKRIVTPGKNQKRYVAGALSSDGRDLRWITGVKKDSWLFISLLEELRRKNPGAEQIHVVLDTFKIHDSQAVQRYLAQFGNLFVLHFLPPYCPDDNRIERLWRELHANATRNHRQKTIEDLMTKVARFLARERARRRKRARGFTSVKVEVAA